jgi:glutamate 5-kinase
MVQADYLFLMTDVDCLYTSNPRVNPSAEAIEVVPDVSALQADVTTPGSALGTGSMSTKIVAAEIATSAGVTTIITRSFKPENVYLIVEFVEAFKPQERMADAVDLTKEQPAPVPPPVPVAAKRTLAPPLHTRFLPSSSPIRDRSFWLLHSRVPRGTIYIDHGAHVALLNRAGLFPVGVVDVEGHFAQQEAVRIVVVKRSRYPSTSPQHSPRPTTPEDALTNGGLASYEGSVDIESAHRKTEVGAYEKLDPPPLEVGRAIVNYSSTEIMRIKGSQSGDILTILGYADSEYVALRENISLFQKTSKPASGQNTPTATDPM